MALPTASDNKFPKLIVQEAANDGSDFSNPAADYRVLFLGEDGLLHVKDSSGTVTSPYTGGSGAVATDAIWDAAGDLAVGSGADTAAKLAKGAAGANLSTYNGVVAWNGGTSFPASPATGDRYWRSDLGMEAYYDGTRWLSSVLYRESFSVGSTTFSTTTDNSTAGRITPWHSTYDLWMVTFYTTTYVAATNSGSLYWTVALQKRNAADSPTTIVSHTTAADTQANWVSHSTAVGALLTPGTYPLLSVLISKTSTPGGIYFAGAVAYRLVLT